MPSTPVASINVSLSASRRIATADGLAGFFLIPWSPDTVSPASTSNSLSSVSPTSSGSSSATLAAMASRAFLRCSPMIRLSTDSAGNRVPSRLRYSRARASKAAVCSSRHDSS